MTIEEVPTVKIRQARKEIENFQDQLSQLEQAREEKIENYASSRDRQYELASLRDEIVQKLAIAEKSNKAAFFRHQGELEKIIVEMETAEVLSNKLKSEIEKLEYDLEVAKINGHVFEGRENEVEAFEKEVQNYEKDLADYRLEQEKKLADNSMRQMRRQIEQNQADKAESERYQLEMNRKSEAAFNNLKPIMHESLQKQRKMEKAQADEKFREQNRMAKSVNDLKDTLQKNTENYHVGLRKKAVRDKRETSPEEAIQELMEKHDMLEDMATILYENQKRNQLWEQELEHRKKERQQREEEIIMKLRRENQFLKKTESKQRTERLLNRDRNDPNLLKKKNLTQQVRRIRQLEHYRRPFSAESSSGSVLEGIGSSRDFVMSQHSKSFVDEEIHLSEDYAPLWDGVAPHDEENLSYKPVSAKQVANLTDKIVADPSTIDFLDFDLQKEYTINVTLTNAANEKTPIRLARLSDNVMDLCSWDFTVLPSISPGISVNFQISFYPQMLESIDGYAEFKTLFGVFKLPIKMRPPKYEPRISHDQVEFGNVILGETMQKEIRIENVGALGGQISVDFSNLSDEFEVIPRFEHLKLPPKDTKKLIIKWTPKTEGHFNLPLFIETNVSFDDKKKLEISGHASLLPVNLSHHTLDFKVCSYGFLYQNQFTIHNSSNVSQPFSFNIPQNLQNAITISPQTGSVQAHASSKIHVKFTPTVDSSFDHFLDEDTSVLEFPLDVSFQNFQKPLTTTIYAIINDPSLKIEENCLNFGNTTIFESTVHRVKITSRSLLLEEFGFSELPNFVSVRPGHGFASLAPSETMEIDIVFSPMQASKYEFTIILETLKGFKHRFKCTGVGVKPPLEISNQHLKLSTPLFSVNRATFTLSNTHTSRDEFSRPVARIGNGKIFPVTSTSFSFMPPEDCNLHFSPSVGVLKPGESVLVTVTHEPFISEERIYEMGRSFPPPEAQVPSEPAQSSKKSIKRSKLPSKTPSRVSSRRESRQSSNSVSRVSSASTIPPPPVEKNDARYCKAKSILSENFGERRDRFSIPCYISSEDVSKGRSWKNPSFDSGYCLFIDAELETTRPALVLENGMDVINMGPRPVGTTEKHYFYLKNR
ncbi:unnamed protein product [Oikopleura dioica]|uniref:MSP domain-containing protein n=1 Tax=Oikopleura dioica TaxID=34765 RepID=E4X4L0_OIKDI|nr:unnamed protein product [Oikopleura dioica]